MEYPQVARNGTEMPEPAIAIENAQLAPYGERRSPKPSGEI